MGGRLFWASMSVYTGRKKPISAFSYSARCCMQLCRVPAKSGASHCLCYVFLSSFACMVAASRTVSSYLMFGTRYVGAIYGLLLTARSMADIFGPVLVNYIREYNV